MNEDNINIDINGSPFHVNKKKENSKTWMAQKIGDTYWVMVGKEGYLYNPLDSSEILNKKDRERGGMFFQLRKCKQICYDYYVAFLRSKNRTHFILAQRALNE